MIEEADPVGSEELVFRRIPNLVPDFVNFDLPMPVMRLAFQPSRSDADGLSVFREIFTTARDVAASGSNPRGYYVASLAVEAILGLSLTVIPNPLADGPRGHALIPEIHTDLSRATKNLQIELAKLASRNIVVSPE